MQTITLGSQESLAQIARAHGFLVDTIWNHADNQPLQATRKHPNVLAEGDQVVIPDRTERIESCGTEETHVFTKKGERVELRLILKAFGEPRANEPYTLVVGSEIIEGSTDGSGLLSAFVPASATEARLLLDEGEQEIALRISRLDPHDTIGGVQQRLNNLGFPCGPETGELNPRTQKALRSFQTDQDLPVTGEADAATKDALDAAYEK